MEQTKRKGEEKKGGSSGMSDSGYATTVDYGPVTLEEHGGRVKGGRTIEPGRGYKAREVKGGCGR